MIEPSSINHPDVTLFIWLIDFALDFDERFPGFGQFCNLLITLLQTTLRIPTSTRRAATSRSLVIAIVPACFS